ncbi:MAG: hypothetical protein OEO23_07245, partial [Gemmatimonadota bacterium]|nr:hypothetical protein [Gemmatimonadota bacterium]
MTDLSVHMGTDADTLLSDDGFRKAWAALADACPWSTVFQRPEFVVIWYQVYRERQDPVLVVARAPDGRMTGLLTLALHRGTDRLTCAGAPVAEYQTWLATEEQGAWFIQRALEALSSARVATLLRFLCL